jgi:hypothetical protein
MTNIRNRGSVLCAVAVFGFATQASALTQLGFALDSSGSISPPNWSLQIDGLANALNTVIPAKNAFGEIELTVVSFGTVAGTIVAPTLINDAATLASVTTAISNATQNLGTLTNMSAGIDLLTNLVTTSTNFGGGNESLLNLSSDGLPNEGGGTAGAQVAALAAAQAGIDGLSAEAIGNASLGFLQTLVFPKPGVVVLPGSIPDPRTTGFVVQVASFAAFEAVMTEKITAVVDPIIPEPATATLYGLSLLVLYGCRRVLR